MAQDYLKKVKEFNINSLPDLDEIVLASLQFLKDFDLPKIDTETYRRPLVIGSVNAFRTGRIVFSDSDAIVADEGNYKKVLEETDNIDAIYIISASGGKHATEIARKLSELELPLFLITSNVNAPAAEFINHHNVLLFPHIREPYTYNTSTYMSMMLSIGNESPADILSFIEEKITPLIPETWSNQKAFTFILPTKYDVLKGLLMTKFDELFGPELVGRAFTVEQIKHAKTVIPSDKEFFISFGQENSRYGKEGNRLTIPLLPDCGPAALMAISYFVIGHIQKQHPPFFKENIVAYTKVASEIFGYEIKPIVE